MRNTETNLPLWLAFFSMNEQATRDWLTGLYNRRYFEETLADHMAAATRYGRELSLILFDIDHFKQINDTHGHDAGDQTLRKFANLLSSTARKADIVCRYGGDEFAVLLPETGISNAWKFARRVFQALEESSPGILSANHGQDAHSTNFSATAGSAALPCESLVAEADSDLRARKAESRR
ncbi:MAG: GGDEF domain-containing protein [Verrucomicrobiota bacterium]|nr:GGDEF domain-containing protein [Verrucomicrobiota bacterium]